MALYSSSLLAVCCSDPIILILTAVQVTIHCSVKLYSTYLLVVVDELRVQATCKHDLAEYFTPIQVLTQSTPACHTYFHIQIISTPVICALTSVYCVSPIQWDTLTPYVRYVFRHQMPTLISSKSVLTLALDKCLPMVCFTYNFIIYLAFHYTFSVCTSTCLSVPSMLVTR